MINICISHSMLAFFWLTASEHHSLRVIRILQAFTKTNLQLCRFFGYQVSSWDTPKIYKPLPTWNLTEIYTPKNRHNLKPEIHVPKHHVWHVFVKYRGGVDQPNLQTLGHVQPPPFEMDTLDTLETSLLLATGSASSPRIIMGQKSTPPMKVFQGWFFLCVWDGRRKKKNSHGKTKILIG